MRSKQTVETSIFVAVIALTVLRLEQIATADRNENQPKARNSSCTSEPKEGGVIIGGKFY